MTFRDISNDTASHYTLGKNEQCVFFLLNRGGEITFELEGAGATAHVFAFFIGSGQDTGTLNISQTHLARETTSHVLVKSILTDAAWFSYRGTIRIAQEASLADASQENRNLLLSREAKAFSEPALEILNSDVRCHHAATTSPLNREALFAAEARGLSPAQAKKLLVDGFLRSSLEALSALAPSQDSEKMLALVRKVAK